MYNHDEFKHPAEIHWRETGEDNMNVWKKLLALVILASFSAVLVAQDQAGKETVGNSQESTVSAGNAESDSAAEDAGEKDLPKSDKVVPYKGWMTEMEKALKKARKENKAVFAALVGHAEWDSGAAALEEEVFSDKSFVKALQKDYVLVKISFPKNSKDLTAEERSEFSRFRKKYAPEASRPPVILLIDSDGTVFGKIILRADEIRKIGSSGFLKLIQKAARPAGGTSGRTYR